MTVAPAALRPFRVLGLQQIAIGGPSKAALRRLWVDLFGVPVTGTYRSACENDDEDVLVVACQVLRETRRALRFWQSMIILYFIPVACPWLRPSE